MTSKTTNKFSPEVRTRAVRMVLDHARRPCRRGGRQSPSVAAKIGCTGADASCLWMKKAEVRTAGSGMAVRPTEVNERAEGARTGEPRASAGQRDPAQGERLFAMAELDRRRSKP